MNFLGIDPGKDKCGVAVLNSDGEIIFDEAVYSIGPLRLNIKFEQKADI